MTKLNTVLENLEERLNYASYRYCASGLEPQDVKQNMVLAIIEQAEIEPDFLDQKPAYIFQKAVWKGAQRQIDYGVAYNKYVGDLERRTDKLEEYIEPIELVVSEEPTPEQDALEKETLNHLLTAIRDLEEKDQTIIAMTYQGYKGKEIAKKLGVTSATISQHRKAIRLQLETFATA
jgi:RNA polymerase sigma factor (sigma-70 family)